MTRTRGAVIRRNRGSSVSRRYHKVDERRTAGLVDQGEEGEVELSKTQSETLLRLARSRDGSELAPAGYSTAGRDAARWWRTMKILARHGFVTWRTGTDRVRITSAGRERLFDDSYEF